MPRPDRRLVIADTAITLLAREGSHGLTHLAVDAECGWAKGSTSYYFRSRAALLEAAARRLVEIEHDETTALLEPYAGDGPSLATGLARLVAVQSAGEARARTIARFELFLIGTRDAAIAELLTSFRQQFLRTGTGLLLSVPLDDARAAAAAAVTVVEGMLAANIRESEPVWGEEAAEPLLAATLEHALRRVGDLDTGSSAMIREPSRPSPQPR